jgi:hypothetical protein
MPTLEIVKRDPEQSSFQLLLRRWVVNRTFVQNQHATNYLGMRAKE